MATVDKYIKAEMAVEVKVKFRLDLAGIPMHSD
jgi:hypothetical protein